MREETGMVSLKSKVESLGLVLPEPASPIASYLPYVREKDVIYVSGQLPMREGKIVCTGKVGREVGLEDAKRAAELCGLNLLGQLWVASEEERLFTVKRVLKLTGFVHSADDFYEQPQVINGASDLMERVFGESGRHARSAVGVNVLPKNVTVEIEGIFLLD